MKLLNPVQLLVGLIVALMVLIRLRSLPTWADNCAGYLSPDRSYGCGICLHCFLPFLIMGDKEAAAVPNKQFGYFTRIYKSLRMVWGGLEICDYVRKGDIDGNF